MKKIIHVLTVASCVFAGSTMAQDPTLEDYLAIAAENNPELQAQYKAFEAALEKIPQVTGLPDPTLSFGYFISPVETRVGPQRARFSLNQMFPWFGTLKASGDVAALKAEAQYQAFLDQKNQLFYRVSASYYPLYELNQWLTLERENAEIMESYKTIATTKFENAEGTLVDVLRVDLMLKDATTTIEILEEKRQPLESTFNTLLNQSASTPIEIPDTLIISAEAQEISQDSLFRENPVLEELDLKIKASEAQGILAEKQGLPKIGIGLDYVMVGQREDLAPGMSIQDDGQDALMPMVSLSLPLYRGKYRAAKKEAQLMQQGYSLQKEGIINDLITNFEVTTFELSQQSQLIALYQEQIGQTRQVLNLLLTAYSNSGKEFEEVLRVQQQLLTYQKMKATALMKYHIALAKLNYLTAKNY
ncbi:TolC family protein [Tunicatimonas pelagia]|uniref:TolC family protein n=1 Tax=Tunicatimonas pelagia TaxID=931531 RepID=UPI002665191B|nr:TolC family protein [Tunicatimonas pelagia]WKN45393.1 TolC family protein [Tunicatimonas pelagia]